MRRMTHHGHLLVFIKVLHLYKDHIMKGQSKKVWKNVDTAAIVD